MNDADSALDVRESDDSPFPVISDALDGLGPDERLRLAKELEPAPPYDALADRGFERETDRIAADEWHVTIERA